MGSTEPDRSPVRRMPSKFSPSKMFANLSPSAAFRKGKLWGGEDAKLTPEAEAHLCQLAALENYADHGMFVKFTDEEASSLEQRALDYALKDSKHDGKRSSKQRKADPKAQPSKSSQTFSREEAERLLLQLRTPEDPLFAHVAPTVAAGGEPPASAVPAAGGKDPKAGRTSTFAAFKRRLLPKKSKSISGGQLRTVPKASNELPPGTLGQGYTPGTYDQFAAEAAEMGMEYSNGFIFPAEDAHTSAEALEQMEAERLAQALRLSAAQADGPPPDVDADGAIMAVAIQESKSQADFDEVLREACQLRDDLDHERSRCHVKGRESAAEAAGLDAKRARLGKSAPSHLLQEAGQARLRAEEMEERAQALQAGVEELGHLEAYIRSQQPPKHEAVALTEAIMRELLEQLNLMGFNFHLPAAPEAPAQEVTEIVAKYRSLNPASPTRKSPQKSSPGRQPGGSDFATGSPLPLQSLTGSKAGEDQETPLHTPRQATPPRPQSSFAAPLKAAPSSTASNAGDSELGRASSRLLKAAPDATPSSLVKGRTSGRTLSMERSSSMASSMSWDRLKLGGPDTSTLKRTPQVVHLYNEMRKVFPEVMGKRCIKPQASQGKVSPFASSANVGIVEAAKRREVSAAVKEAAEKHSRQIARLSSTLTRAKLEDMPAAVELASEIRGELARVKPDAGEVLAESPGWPAEQWEALVAATATFEELEEMSERMRDWRLGQGSFEQEVLAMETCLDSSRVRMEAIQEEVRRRERGWLAKGIPWEGAAFRRTRTSSLNIAMLCMSRALIEVANLERNQRLQAEACIKCLADAVRVAYKSHQLAGGFSSDAGELFERVKSLAQYYVRSRDPTWLRDNSRLA